MAKAKRRNRPGKIGRPPQDRRGEYAARKAKGDQAILDKLARRQIAIPTAKQVVEINRTRS